MGVGLSGCQTIGLSDYRVVGLSGRRTIELSDYRAVGILGLPLLSKGIFIFSCLELYNFYTN